MWPIIKKFFTDETAFVGVIRAALLGLGGLAIAQPEMLPMLPAWLGPVALAAGGFVRAGERNKKEE